MKIKTAELKDKALDYAVALCEGTLPASFDDWTQTWPSYSTNWSAGGPLIEREGISVIEDREACVTERGTEILRKVGWLAYMAPAVYWRQVRHSHAGDTFLVAGLRCRVAYKLGEEVEIPDELL